MKKIQKTNGSYGKGIWEEKIKAQNEVGVIHGTTSSMLRVNNQTKGFMQFFDKEIVPILKKQSRILDLGTGPMARFSIEFAKRGYIVTGVDISPTMLEYAQKYIKKTGAKVSLIEDDISILSKVNSKQDLIFCYETFFHIPPFLTLKSLKRFNELLEKEGYCLVQFAVKTQKKIRDYFIGPAYWTGHYIKRLFGKGFNVNVSRFTEEEINSMIKESGFEIQKKYKTGLYLIKKKNEI